MSKYIRGNKRQILVSETRSKAQQQQPGKPAIPATMRNPLSQAAVGIASMMLVSTSATAQDANAPPKPTTSTVGQQDASQLPKISVRATKRTARKRQAPTAPPVTPPAATAAADAADRSYQGSGVSNLTRVPTPLLNTPQTVNVVPRAVIREQNPSNVADALRNVAGVTFRAGEGGNQGDTPYIRGFSAQSDIFRDGLRDPGLYTRDTFAVDAIEVYKGPSSVLFGRGSTGGAINLITKLPEDRTFVEGTITGNTGAGVRGTLDANTKVNDQVSTRIVVMGQRYDIPDRDHVEVNRWGVAPSIKVKINSQTTNTTSYIYQHDDNIPDYGIPFMAANGSFGFKPRSIAPVNRSNWYGILSGGDPDTERVDAHILTNKFEHEFNKDVKVVNTTRYTNVDRFQRNVFPEPAPATTTGTWTPNRAQVMVTNTMVANATDLIAKFNTGFLEHTTVTGVEVNRETRNFSRNQYARQAGTSLLSPDAYRFGGTVQTPTASQVTLGEATDIAFYAADQIKINRYFELLGSIRVENYTFEQTAPRGAASVANLKREDNLVSWRVGGVFHPTLNSSIYVMHGTSFNPSADNLSISPGTNAAQNAAAIRLTQLKPEQNETTEVGVKADVLDGKLTLASAVFHTVKTNMRVPDPANSSVMVLDGEVTANGFEASATGYLTKLWQVIASYTYVNARITKTTTPSQLNTEPVNTPTQAFSLWTTYDITPQWQIGGGAFYNSETYGDTANLALVPSWWRFDLMAAYKISPKATLQFNLYNVTDKLYYTSAYTNWAVPAAGRLAALTLRVRY
ncbi:MAG: TonB-dependent siderophore receptor [Xanthobacteraceae bacterium]|nr:TonB-dependent siderophore receptor [Xanthobacteraceae bacterium]